MKKIYLKPWLEVYTVAADKPLVTSMAVYDKKEDAVVDDSEDVLSRRKTVDNWDEETDNEY